MKKVIDIPEYYSTEVKQLIQWCRDNMNYEPPVSYKDDMNYEPSISYKDDMNFSEEEFKSLIYAEMERQFNEKWSHIL